MIFKTSTLLPSYYPPTPLESIDDVIMYLWTLHLDIELANKLMTSRVMQSLEVTAALIDFWEEKSSEINKYEIQQRRSGSSKDS